MTLRFQSTERQAWLVELDDNSARTQGDLCNRHAAALVLPRGWELHDERAGSPAVAEGPKDETPKPSRGGRRARARRRVEAEPAPEPPALPGLDAEREVEPDVPGNGSPRGAPAEFGANDDDAEVVDDALDAILDARTPLLRRAFRNARPE